MAFLPALHGEEAGADSPGIHGQAPGLDTIQDGPLAGGYSARIHHGTGIIT